MDSKSEENDDVSAIKQMRANLETRIGNQRLSQQQRIASLQTLVPGLVSSIDLSLKVVSDFNGLHYTPTPIPPTPISQNPNPIAPNPQNPNPKPPPNLKPKPLSRRLPSKPVSMIGNPLSVVRSMVAVCLLERVPFMPIDSATVLRKLESDQSATEEEKAALLVLGGDSGGILSVEKALRSIGDDKIGVELDDFVISGTSRVMVLSIDRNRLVKEFPESCRKSDWKLNSGDDGNLDFGGAKGGDSRMGSKENSGQQMHSRNLKRKTVEDLIEEMLNKKSVKELKSIQTGEEILDLINRPTAKETTVIAKFKTKGGSQVKEYCPLITKDDCRRHSGSYFACEKVHYTRLIAAHTDISLGQCSFLNACRHMKTCKHIHYEIDLTEDVRPIMMNDPPPKPIKIQRPEYCSEVELGHPQWINCDIRSFRMDILGQFGVIMADPPWDIHMQLPYGTMADDEMRALNISGLQTDGLIFLWVTGRAMELGRECLDLWGYKCIEEIIWVKTNQLQRIIRTGRTGHWLNHSKEHCLVGIKGNPEVIRNIDTDVIVAEVRETSRKPDEMYPLLERISPRTRKLELFARTNNLHAGWISLGNQLKGVRLVDEGLRARFKAAYPEVEVEPKSPPRTPALEIE